MAATNGCNSSKSLHTTPHDTNSSFYLITPRVEPANITGATHLLTSYDLLSAYNKFSSKKVKQNLSSFISHLPGPVDTPATEDNSGLLSLVQRHPPVLKEIKPLTGAQLTGFRLYPGPIPEQYKIPLLQETQSSKVKKHKKKKSKKRHQSGELGLSLATGGSSINISSNLSSSSIDIKNGSTPVSALSSITVASSRHNTNQSLSALTSGDVNVTSEPFASSANEIPSSLTSDKKNRKRVYEERDEKKKKKDKKKKRKKEIPSD